MIMPNWHRIYTQKQAEDVIVGFKFKGEGWYDAGNGDLALVMKDDDETAGDDIYWFFFFTGDPREVFKKAVNAPFYEV